MEIVLVIFVYFAVICCVSKDEGWRMKAEGGIWV
jgi:hypothetical protein